MNKSVDLAVLQGGQKSKCKPVPNRIESHESLQNGLTIFNQITVSKKHYNIIA